MLSTQSLREQMDRYASGVLAADALEEWLAAESWDMRRWAPRGLQHFVEALQAVFIKFSEGKLSHNELHEYLLLRRAQLRLAEEATKQNVRPRAVKPLVVQEPTEAVSEAIIVKAAAVPAA
jgi:hypothetical protein